MLILQIIIKNMKIILRYNITFFNADIIISIGYIIL